MRISAILYGLYLIFLHGGRLNQQRLSSVQSASRQRVLHPLPLSLILHSALCLCVFFVIVNEIHVCGEVPCMCPGLTMLSEVKHDSSGREKVSNILKSGSIQQQGHTSLSLEAFTHSSLCSNDILSVISQLEDTIGGFALSLGFSVFTLVCGAQPRDYH